MGLSIHDFWQLVVASGLHDEEDCRRLADGYAKARDDGDIPRTTSLPEWMLNTRAITRYQAKILLSGKPGPFLYGDYLLSEPCETSDVPRLFRAAHRPTKTNVLLYFVSGPALDDPQVVSLLAAHAAAAAAISRDNPHLTHCHTFVETAAFKFFVLETLPKKTLAEWLSGRPVAVPDAVRIAWQLTHGLAALHRAGQAHGAVRPARIWLSAASGAQLATYPLLHDPLAFASVETTPQIDPAVVEYTAPECAAGQVPQRASDIFGLGCTLYQLLTARVPFPGIAATVDAAAPLAVNQINAKVPAPLAALIGRMLDADPKARVADAEELTAALLPIAKQCNSATLGQLPGERKRFADWLAAHGGVPAAAPGTVVTPAPLIMVSDGLAAPAASSTVRIKQSRNRLLPLVGGIAAALLVVAGVAAWLLFAGAGNSQQAGIPAVPPPPSDLVTAPMPTDEQDQAQPEAVGDATSSDTAASPTTATQPPAKTPPPAAQPAADNVVGLSGTMWASPTHGRPIDLKYLVPGAEVIVVVRPAELFQRSETEKILDPRTSGVVGQFFSEQLVAFAGTPLDGIERAVIGFFTSTAGPPRLALVITLREPAAIEALEKAWGKTTVKEHEGVTYYEQGDRAFYLPEAEGGRTVVIGPADLIAEEVIPAGANPPPMNRELETLLAVSDADRDLTVLAAPAVLYTGGRDWLPGNTQRLRAPLDWFLAGHDTEAPAGGDKMDAGQMVEARMVDLSSHGMPGAVLASAHLSDNDLFLEVRIFSESNRPTTTVAEEFGQRVTLLTGRASEFIRGLALSEYSRDVLFGFPLMVEQLERNTNVGTDGKQVVLRAYLPAIAAHNLFLGSHLALLEQPRAGGGQVAATARPAQGAARPAAGAAAGETVAGRLERKTSLEFSRATLEQALQTLGDDLGVEIVIMGSDLQLEGITKNQSFQLAEKDQSARDILRKIMLKANPDGKLIYVIKPSAGGQGEALYITTRAAAKKRGDQVPTELAEQP